MSSGPNAAGGGAIPTDGPDRRADAPQSAALAPVAAFRYLPDALGLATSTLLARLEFWDDRLVHTTFPARGLAESRLLDPADLASALAGRRVLRTGLLGPDALFVVQRGATTHTGVWSPPRRWPTALMRGGLVTDRLMLPMPGAVVVTGSDGRHALFAATARPAAGCAGLAQPLYRYPAFNLNTNETICAGSHIFGGDPWRTLDDFFESFFAAELTGQGRSRRHPDDLLARWRELDGAADYPLADLVPVADPPERFAMANLLRWLEAGMPHALPLAPHAGAWAEGVDDDADDDEGWDEGEDEDDLSGAGGDGAAVEAAA